MQIARLLCLVALCTTPSSVWAQEPPQSEHLPRYRDYVQQCIETLMERGSDRYGKKTSPIFVSILDAETRKCPQNPEKLDADYRVVRRGRRLLLGHCYCASSRISVDICGRNSYRAKLIHLTFDYKHDTHKCAYIVGELVVGFRRIQI